MSPALKSKLKAKEQPPKPTLKLSTAPFSSAYNPLSGTFHSMEVAQSLAARGSSRFQAATDDSSEEYDCPSSESCSGESLEDPKERQPVPGIADTDKREKIRQKNEKKHQRQRQRRADELFARCTSFLMSRKLENLAQQMVSMGFSQEEATKALIANRGYVDEAVMWLLEAGGGDKKSAAASDGSDDCPRINIDDELAAMAKLEVQIKCSKQDLHKAVVACEGDLDKAAQALKAQKQNPLPPLLPTVAAAVTAEAHNGLIRSPPLSQSSLGRPQTKPLIPLPSQPQQQRRQEPLGSRSKIVPPPKAQTPPLKRPLPPPPLPPSSQLGSSPVEVKAAPVVVMRRHQSTLGPAPGGMLAATSARLPAGVVNMEALKMPGQNYHLQRPAQAAPPSPLLAMPSSLGLFPSGLSVNWSGSGGESVAACDYNYVDWSPNSAATAWRPFPAIDRATVQNPVGIRWAATVAVEQHGSEGPTFWTNAFEGRDLFSLSRKVVMSSP